MANSDPDKLIAKADKLTKLSMTRWNADWKNATVLYEQAAIAYRLARKHEKAKDAFEKASKGQEMLSSPWDAAKHMESAAALAKEVGNWNEVSDFYRRASELYIQCGRTACIRCACKGCSIHANFVGKGLPNYVCDILKDEDVAPPCLMTEDALPDEAIQLYTDACAVLEDDGKEQMAFDLYRAATSVYVKLEKYTDAATFLLRWALAADKCNATHSQSKAYLSAIIVYLYAHDFQQAEKCYNDCCQVEAFLNSDQNRAATRLLSAYTDGDVEEIKRAAQSSIIFQS
ncbi:UNVERIFIED_CONTAM: Gamma-soluble NSF attachment protein [Sesamum angustifolium]|uniref:Gamma-soluble NSF attachment protein n=1 Tax=Sesamum angustifolium TaxID=2727405 RepID=A0AAW2P9H1_9LAMI